MYVYNKSTTSAAPPRFRDTVVDEVYGHDTEVAVSDRMWRVGREREPKPELSVKKGCDARVAHATTISCGLTRVRIQWPSSSNTRAQREKIKNTWKLDSKTILLKYL
jgi:hypothetical protein